MYSLEEIFREIVNNFSYKFEKLLAKNATFKHNANNCIFSLIMEYGGWLIYVYELPEKNIEI